MRSTPARRLAFLTLLTVVPACVRSEPAGPPMLRLGRDECAECGMILSEDRCCAALLVERNARREHLLFDDLGCLVDHEQEHASEHRVVEGYVRDYATRAWLPWREAAYIHGDGDRLHTPMGFGMVAFADRAAAEHAARDLGAVVVSFNDLPRLRREWLEARYGKPR